MTARSDTQPRILAELEVKEMTDGQIAAKLGTTQHGVRAALNVMHRRGEVVKIIKKTKAVYWRATHVRYDQSGQASRETCYSLAV